MKKQWTKLLLFFGLLLFFLPNRAFAGEWVQADGAWAYLENGVKVTNRWIEENGQWFYLKPDGRLAQSEWINESGVFYFMMQDGAMAQKQWLQWNGKTYYLGKSGAMAHNQCVDGYYLSYDGVWKHENEKEVKASGRIEDEVQGRGRRQKKKKQYDDYFDDEVDDVDDADA